MQPRGRLGVPPPGPAPDSASLPGSVVRSASDARRFLPWLEPDDLAPAMCGMRPKLAVTGFGDFVISREEGDFGGLINLVGIESPGLTSAPAIAREVAGMVREMVE